MQQPISGKIILVTGAARSGKSEWAETLANQNGDLVIYIATARIDPDDLEWQKRIEQHQQRRPPAWKTLIIPENLTKAIEESSSPQCLLIDSLGTWVANLLDQDQITWEKTTQDFLNSLQQTTANLILVAEETGWGVVPAYPLGRVFRDRLGSLIRHIGAIANPVYLVTGGHVLNLSLLGKPLSIEN